MPLLQSHFSEYKRTLTIPLSVASWYWSPTYIQNAASCRASNTGSIAARLTSLILRANKEYKLLWLSMSSAGVTATAQSLLSESDFPEKTSISVMCGFCPVFLQKSNSAMAKFSFQLLYHLGPNLYLLFSYWRQSSFHILMSGIVIY